VSELQGIARITLHEGKLEEFKRVTAQCMEIVRTKDTGTLLEGMLAESDVPLFTPYQSAGLPIGIRPS
jgi:hypothetical protein